MKKKRKKEILYLFLFAVILLVVEVFLPGTHKNEKQSALLETVEESQDAYGDTTCPTGCNCTILTNGGSGNWFCGPNAAAYQYVSNNQECYYKHKITCGNGCHETKKITGVRCDSCKSGYHSNGLGGCVANASSTPTPTIEPCKIKSFTQYNMLSVNDQRGVTVTLTGSCSDKTVTVSGSNGISYVGKKDGSYMIVASNACGKTGSYTVSIGSDSKTQKVLIINQWITKYNYITDHMPSYDSKEAADKVGLFEYGSGCMQVAIGKYHCSEFGWRGCGDPGTPQASVPPIDDHFTAPEPGCYADSKNLNEATRAKWQDAATVAYPKKVEKFPGTNIKITQETCKPMEKITMCTPELTTSKLKEITTDECEENLDVPYTDGKTCTGTSFYKIECTNNKVNFKYDNGDDVNDGNAIKTTVNLLPGQGFSFGIKAEVIKDGCTATFYSSTWLKIYNRIQDQRKTIKAALKLASVEDKKTLNSRLAELDTKEEKLKQFAIDYNNETKDVNLNMNMNFEMTYPANDGEKVLKTPLESTVINEGTVKVKTTDENILIANELTVKNYSWTNKADPLVLKLIFPKTYIDKHTGDITTNSKNAIDGGNKAYISYNAKSSVNGEESSMLISITGKIDKNEVFKVDNDKCKIAVFSSEVKYRPIELTNPFINKNYRKGENWVNDMYDFTKTIDANIWSKNALYDINLTAEQIDEVKASNEKNKADSPYLGLCDKTRDIDYDDITKIICNALN